MAAAAGSAAVDALLGLSWSSRWLWRRREPAPATVKLPLRRRSAAAAQPARPLFCLSQDSHLRCLGNSDRYAPFDWIILYAVSHCSGSSEAHSLLNPAALRPMYRPAAAGGPAAEGAGAAAPAGCGTAHRHQLCSVSPCNNTDSCHAPAGG